MCVRQEIISDYHHEAGRRAKRNLKLFEDCVECARLGDSGRLENLFGQLPFNDLEDMDVLSGMVRAESSSAGVGEAILASFTWHW